MSGNKSTKKTEAALATQLVAGIGKHFASATNLTFASETFTPAQLTSAFQTLVKLRQDVDGAKANAKAKLAAEEAQAPALRLLMAAFVSFVRTTFSKSPDILADFGLQPKKAKTPLTVEQKAAAAAKREATRKARNTMGSKQRKSVKGNVTNVVLTPVTAVEQHVAPGPVAPAAPTTSGNGAGGGSNPHGA